MRIASLKSFSTILITVAALAILSAPPSQAQVQEPRGISVSGQGEVSAVPDIARISIGVTTDDRDAAKAASENAEKASQVVQTLLAAGIAKKDLQTSQYSLQQMYDYKISPPKPTGFQASNVIRVTVRDLSKVGMVIDKTTAVGANTIQGISFDIDDDSAYRDQALARAVKAAASKAKIIADNLKVSLGRVLFVSESVGGPVYPMYKSDMARGMAAGAPETPTMAGEIKITATVSIVFDIKQ